MRKLSVLTFAAMLFGSLTTTWADPPAGRGGVGSTLQRAVDSRAGLQQRANARAQGSANTGVGVGVGAGQNSANANGSVSASLQAETNGSANAQSGTGRLPREVVVRRLQLLRSQQSAVVRTANRAEVGIGLGDDSTSEAPATSKQKPQPNNKPPRGKSGQSSNPNPNSKENTEAPNRSGLISLNGSARSEVVAHGQNRMALTNADKILAQRLARIDQMRDQALESGNDQLLDQADRLELDARTQFAERLAANANESSTETGANAQGQAAGVVRGRINRTAATNPNPGTPATDGNNPDGDASSGLSGDAAAATQNEAAATFGKARRTTDRTRRETKPAEPAGRVRNASISGQANSTNAASAAAANRSLNATGASATSGAASAQSK